MPYYGASGEKNGDIWHENSRKTCVWVLAVGGEGEEGNFAKVSGRLKLDEWLKKGQTRSGLPFFITRLSERLSNILFSGSMPKAASLQTRTSTRYNRYVYVRVEPAHPCKPNSSPNRVHKHRTLFG